MKTIQQLCDNCTGTGITVNWEAIDPVAEDSYGVLKKVECCACGGTGYNEYAMFTVKEAQAILKHCGITTGEIGDI